MPVSKKRRKKRTKSSGPPVSKEAQAARKTGKMTKQRLALYVISALIILAMAVGVIASAFAPAPVTQGGQPIDAPIVEPIPDDPSAPAEGESTNGTAEESSSATGESDAEN